MADNSLNKILLLNPPASKKYLRDYYCSKISSGAYYWQPSDLAVLSGILNEYKLYVIDAIVEKKTQLQIIDFIKENKINIVISLIGASSYQEDISTLNLIKRKCSCYVGITGDIVQDDPIKTFTELNFIDIIITNFTSLEIATLFHSFPFCKKKYFGVNYRNHHNQIIINDNRQNQKLISIPLPQHNLFPLNKYQLPFFNSQGSATISSSFGCPYKCDFCILGTMPYCYRSPESVVNEIKLITSLGYKQFIFRDPLFEVDINRAKKICQQIIDNKLNVRWSCNSRVDTIIQDKELLPIMKKAGCTMILFGVESGSNRILKSINKKINLKTIKNTFSLCNKLKIPTSGYFIIGLPEDTQNSIIKTINFAIKLNPNFAVFSYPSPDFRTKLRQKMIEDNLLNQDKNIHFDRGGGNNSAIATKHLSSEQIEYFQKLAFKKFYFRWKYFQAHAWKFLTPDRISVIINEFLSMIKNYYLPQKYF